MIGEAYIERRQTISLCFIDLEKPYNRVMWDTLLNVLKDKMVDWKQRVVYKTQGSYENNRWCNRVV